MTLVPVHPLPIAPAIDVSTELAKLAVDEEEVEGLVEAGRITRACSVCLQAPEGELLLTEAITTTCTHDEVNICVLCLRESVGAV